MMASRLDERLLYSGSKLMDELNRKRAWVLSATALEFRDRVSLLLTTDVEATSVFRVTRRLEKHSIWSFICFKLLERCNIFTFSLLVFFLYFMTFSVCYGYLIDHVYISLVFDFWHVLAYGI